MDEEQVYIHDVISAVIRRMGRQRSVMDRGMSRAAVINDFSIYI